MPPEISQILNEIPWDAVLAFFVPTVAGGGAVKWVHGKASAKDRELRQYKAQVAKLEGDLKAERQENSELESANRILTQEVQLLRLTRT